MSDAWSYLPGSTGDAWERLTSSERITRLDMPVEIEAETLIGIAVESETTVAVGIAAERNIAVAVEVE